MSNVRGSNKYGPTAPIKNIVYCNIHSSIQIKRRKRNGEWLQLTKECPLCTADDNTSEWSSVGCASTSGSSSGVSGSGGGSVSCGPTLSFRLQEQSKKKRVRETIATPVSKFKECKDEDQAPKVQDFSVQSTTLPFSSNVDVLPAKVEESDPWDELLLSHRRGKIRDTKKRRSMLSSSRRKISKGVKSGKTKGTNTTSKRVEKLKPSRVVSPFHLHQNFTEGESSSVKAKNFSFHLDTTDLSEAAHHNGTVIKQQQPQDTHGEPTRSFHSESTKHRSNTKSSNGPDDSSIVRRFSSLVISHPKELRRVNSDEVTMVTENISPSKMIDTVNNTAVRQDIRQDKLDVTSSSMESIDKPETGSMQSMAETNEDLYTATYNIWGNSNDSGHDHNQGGETKEIKKKKKGDKDSSRQHDSTSLRPPKNDDSVVDIHNLARRSNDAMAQTPTQPKMIPSEKMARKYTSCKRGHSREQRSKRKEVEDVAMEDITDIVPYRGDGPSKRDKARERPKHEEVETAIMEDIADIDSSRNDGRGDHDLSTGDISRQNPLGRTLANSSKHSSYNSKPDPPGTASPPAASVTNAEERVAPANRGMNGKNKALTTVVDTPSPEGREKKKLRVEQDASAKKSLDDKKMAFDKANSPSPRGRERGKLRKLDKLKSRDPLDIPSITTKEQDLASVVKYLDAFYKVNTPSPKGRERKKLKVHDGVKETDDTTDPSMNSPASRTSSSTESSSSECVQTKESSIKNDEKKETTRSSSVPSRTASSSRTKSKSHATRSSSRTRSPTRVDEVISNGDVQSGTSTQTNLEPKPLKQDNVFLIQESDSSADSKQMFNKCDSKGRCIHHPHIQLKKRKRLGGFKTGKWKTIMVLCTECCFEEVQRLRLKNSRARENILLSQSLTAGLPPASSPSDIPSSGDDARAIVPCDDPIDSGHQIKCIPVKPTLLESSSSSSHSTESEMTTTFSYLSSLSSDTSGFSSTCSSSTDRSPSAVSGTKRPLGILRKNSVEVSSSGLRIGTSFSSSKISGKSNTPSSRVVFAGRDHIINPDVQFGT